MQVDMGFVLKCSRYSYYPLDHVLEWLTLWEPQFLSVKWVLWIPSDFGRLNRILHVNDLAPGLAGAIQEDARCYYPHSTVWTPCRNLVWILDHAEMELPSRRLWRCSKSLLHVVSLVILVYILPGQVSPASHAPVCPGMASVEARTVSTWTLN